MSFLCFLLLVTISLAVVPGGHVSVTEEESLESSLFNCEI